MDTPLTNADYDRAYDFIRANAKRNEFLASLLSQFERKGELSEKQIRAALNTLSRYQRNAEHPRSASDPVTETGIYRNDKGVYRVAKSRQSGNLYALRFVPDAPTRSERFVYEKGAVFALTASDRLTLAQAVELGAQHGLCVVCGAELTDPTSIERGIGPVCAKKV